MGELIVAIIVGVFQTYLMWMQNEIFKKQNEIFEFQAGKGKLDMNENSSRSAKVKRYWPLALMALFALVSWGSVLFAYYENVYRAARILDFDQPESGAPLAGYGGAPGSCYGIINGNVPMVAAHQSDYRAAIACFLFDGTEDILDAPRLQVSRLYDLNPGNITMRANYSPEFMQYQAKTHPIGIEVALLLVPIGTDITDLSTLREARNLKVHILGIGMAGEFQVRSPTPPSAQQ